jgi:hypothetical protein
MWDETLVVLVVVLFQKCAIDRLLPAARTGNIPPAEGGMRAGEIAIERKIRSSRLPSRRSALSLHT